MGKKSRAKLRNGDVEHGFVVDLAYGPHPAGRYWFNTPTKTRTPPPNAVRFIHHTQATGRYRIASARPTTRRRS